MNITIHEAARRNEERWKRKELSFDAFAEKCSRSQSVDITQDQYMKLTHGDKRQQQKAADLKDVGGFFGGELLNGIRSNTSIVNRTLLCLDADFADDETLTALDLCYNGTTYIVYSTFKHTPEKPRYRIIFPMERAVSPEEYEAVARKVAEIIGINYFDGTTFQASRLMFYPAHPKDVEPYFERADGGWLNPDEVLDRYADWHDMTQWASPITETELLHRRINAAIKKQADPLEKTGIVGTFCRAYPVRLAIATFLPDVYEETAKDNRFTFIQGSTFGGAVVYDDKFLYSNHSTDPCSQKLCNAFDLVRIHLYGNRDTGAHANTPNNKLPSYRAMEDLCNNDKRVKVFAGEERLLSLGAAFSGIETETGEEKNDEWMSLMDTDKKGLSYLSTINNIYLMLKHHPELKECLKFDEFQSALLVTRDLPWRKATPQTTDFTDDDVACLRKFLESKSVPFSYVEHALSTVRTEFRVHPVRDYLNALEWDGVNRLDTLLIDFLGAEDNDYVREVTRKTLVGAVARIYEPGIKFDTVLTLVGRKGIMKSELVKRLFGKWFSDSMGDIHDKSGLENLRGVWGMEIAEMDAFNRADIDAIKRFVTSSEDRYRPAYGKQVARHPRQCVFIGTTNRINFLQEADERRFLPVLCGMQPPVYNVWDDLTEHRVSQLWAEAVQTYQAGENADISAEVKVSADEKRAQFTKTDDREGIIINYLSALLPDNWDKMNIYERRAFLKDTGEDALEGTIVRTSVCAAEIWCECMEGTLRDMTTQNTKFIHDIMRRQEGWVRVHVRKNVKHYGLQTIYAKSP